MKNPLAQSSSPSRGAGRIVCWVVLAAAHLSLSVVQSRAEESHPGIGIESMYSEAVLAYNKKQTEEAIKILDQLLRADPNHVQALELKALTLKTKGDDVRSQAVYTKLLKIKPLKERGPYHFELGVIFQRQKKLDVAKYHFTQAVRLRFNEVTSHLFLGLIGFNGGKFKDAEFHFNRVKKDGTPEFKVVAHYYLGLVHFKNGYGTGGTQELMTARTLAADIPESQMATDIGKAADKVLAPFRDGQWFANFTTIGQYDSNITQVPTGLVASTASSGRATPKLMLSGGVGKMTSAMQSLQWVFSYQFSFNKNFNANTKSYEFFTNNPSVYLNFNPLASSSGGLKAIGTFMFQNQAEDSLDADSKYTFTKYNVGVEVGPFLKHQFSRALVVEASAGIKPQKFFSDTGLSGNTITGKLSARSESPSIFFNPSANVSYEKNGADSNDSRTAAIGAGLANQAKLWGTMSITGSVDFLATSYPDASVPRSDKNFTFRVALYRPLSARWALLADASYIKNSSTIPDSYSYNRMMFGAGINLSL